MASATRLPSGDHVGLPGPNMRGVDFRDLAGGDIDDRYTGSAPHPIHVEKCDALPVGGPRRAHRLGGQMGELTILPGLQIADPQLKQIAAFVRRIDQLVSIGRPCRVRIKILVFRDVLGLAPDGHRIDVAEGCERDLLAIRRKHGPHDAKSLAGSGGVEVALAPGIACRVDL